jgi:hypothetical protein
MIYEIQDARPFGTLLAALEPWLDQVVIIGGWAHRLYRLHPKAHQPDYRPLMTLDADIALPKNLPMQVGNMRDRLLAYGFTEEFSGETQPPATHYHLGDENTGFYAEFLTSLKGSALDRKQARKVTTAIAGITTQQLRHIDLLLDKPWAIHFESEQFTGNVQIANPVAFRAQKILIRGARGRADRAKDILYIHDTLEVFGAQLNDLADLWSNDVALQLPPKASKAVSEASGDLFGTITEMFAGRPRFLLKEPFRRMQFERHASTVLLRSLGKPTCTVLIRRQQLAFLNSSRRSVRGLKCWIPVRTRRVSATPCGVVSMSAS